MLTETLQEKQIHTKKIEMLSVHCHWVGVHTTLKTALYKLYHSYTVKVSTKAVHQSGEIKFADNRCIYMLQ